MNIQFSLRTVEKLHVDMKTAKKIHADFNFNKGGNHEEYNGEYQITPKAFKETTLETKDKLMNNNVTVFEIPYFEVGNTQGGNTIYIGKEVDLNGK